MNNLAFQYNESVSCKLKEICEPFLKSIGLKTFRYFKFFPEDKYLLLQSDSVCSREILFNINNNSDIFQIEVKKSSENLHFFVWPYSKDFPWKRDKVFSLYHDLNIWNGLTVYRRHKNYVEGWCFATTIENEQIINTYINNLNKISNFIAYFNLVAKNLIDPLPDRLACFKKPHEIGPLPSLTYDGVQNLNVYAQEEFSYIFYKNQFLRFSKRQKECIFYLLKGKTAWETGKILGCSHRAIEDYLENLKKKLGVNNKVALAAVLANLFWDI